MIGSLTDIGNEVIEVTGSRVLTGPNRWFSQPAIELEVKISAPLAPHGTTVIPLEHLPRASEYDSGHDPSFEVVHDQIGASLARLAMKLQQRAGANVSHHESFQDKTRRSSILAFEYESIEEGLAAVDLAFALLAHTWKPSKQTVRESEKQAGFLRDTVQNRHRFESQREILAAASTRAIPVGKEILPGRIVDLGHGATKKRLQGTNTSLTSSVATSLASAKSLTTHILHEAGIPAPVGMTASNRTQAAEIAETLGFPVVIKPLRGNRSRGVFVDLEDQDRVLDSWNAIQQQFPGTDVLVEQFIPGLCYRITVVDGTVAGVLERVPAEIEGDGKQTIRELVEQRNERAQQNTGESGQPKSVPLDQLTTRALSHQQMTLDAIPPSGHRVVLKPSGLINHGGSLVDRTHAIHPDNAEIAIAAVDAIGLDTSGIDFVTPDISKSHWDHGGAVIEVNTGSGINIHAVAADQNEPPNVARAYIDMLFPGHSPSPAKIVALLGDQVPAVASLLVVALTHLGKSVGHAGKTASSIGGMSRMLDNACSNQTFLNNPEVEIAVLEITPEEILESGLPYDQCDVGIILSSIVEPFRAGRNPGKVVARSVRPDGALIMFSDSHPEDLLDPNSTVDVHALDRPDHVKTDESSSVEFTQPERTGQSVADMIPSAATGESPIVTGWSAPPFQHRAYIATLLSLGYSSDLVARTIQDLITYPETPANA